MTPSPEVQRFLDGLYPRELDPFARAAARLDDQPRLPLELGLVDREEDGLGPVG